MYKKKQFDSECWHHLVEHKSVREEDLPMHIVMQKTISEVNNAGRDQSFSTDVLGSIE